jgi:hypothetical protein
MPLSQTIIPFEPSTEEHMAKVLIVWEEVPETTKFYLADLEGKALKKVLKAQGQFVNSTEDSKEADYVGEELLPDLVALDADSALDAKKLDIDFIVHCGFLLIVHRGFLL